MRTFSNKNDGGEQKGRQRMPTRRTAKSFMNEMEKSTRQHGQNEPANNTPLGAGGIKPNVTDGQKFSNWKDERLRSLVKTIAVFFATIYFSGKLVEYLVDQYVMGNSNVGVADLEKSGEQNYKIGLLKGEEFASTFGNISIYKTENALIDELENLQTLGEKDLKMKSFFGKGKNYFIQVVGNQTFKEPDGTDDMEPGEL